MERSDVVGYSYQIADCNWVFIFLVNLWLLEGVRGHVDRSWIVILLLGQRYYF